jgi:ABC-2 type transport system permease protein
VIWHRTRRLRAIIAANLRMLLRSRTALFFSLLLPIVFMVLFGLIFGSGQAQRTDIAVAGTGPLITGLEHSGAVKVHHYASPAQALQRVKDGHEPASVIENGSSADVRYEASQGTTALIVRSIIDGVAAQVNQQASGRPPAVRMSEAPVESSSLSYIDFLVPGLLAMAISQSAVFGIAGVLVSWRERGMFRRLRLTPLPLWEFATGRIMASLVLAIAQAAVLLTVGKVAFGVNLSAHAILTIIPLVLAGALCFIAIGFLVGSLAKTQEAGDAIGNVVTLPMIFLAGVFFPLDSAPSWLQTVAKLLPLTYLATGLRDLAVRGHSFASSIPDIAVLLAGALVLGAISLRYFRWEST